MSRSNLSRFRSLLTLSGLLLLVLMPPSLGVQPALAATLMIDDFDYASDAEAQAAWLNRGASPKVSMADSGPWGDERVMKLPCNFSALPDRCYWDRLDTFDLSAYPMFALELYVPDPTAVGQFTLYFHSGSGWYAHSHDIKEAGWQTLAFVAQDFQELGTPAGWDQIDTIRLSPWRESGASTDTEMAVRQLRAYSPPVFILRDDEAANQTRVTKAAADLSFMLREYDVSFGVFGDAAIDNGHLFDSKIAVLPYNEVFTVQQQAAIQFFVASGGKLMVYYQLPDWLATLLGFVRLGTAYDSFAAYEFDDATIDHLPARVRHSTWTVTIAEPGAALNARTIAEWEDDDGVLTGHPAWLASDTGTFMSNYIRNDDRLNKQKMLLGLIGHYVPDIWPAAAAAAIARIGRIAEYGSYDEAVADIQSRGATTPRQPAIDAALADADAARNQAIGEEGLGQYPEAVWTAIDARSHLQQAYYLSQSSALPEFRAVWEHAGTGPYPGDWQSGIAPLVANGFTAVFPNSLRAGLAHYPSALLPHSSQYGAYGDQVQQCVDAAHAEGVEVHIWKMNWNLEKAPQDFIDQMRAAGRTQVSAYGAPIDWLCPSHPDNLALEHDSMLEVLQNYDIEGLHFDYIRYPGPDYCYDDGCRTRFEAETGNTINNWPADVRAGGPLESEFLDWRRAQITELVQAVYTSAKALDPEVRISAAVYGDYSQAYGSVGQDWVDWIDRGIVDFLCPMDTTSDYDEFRRLVADQLEYADGRVPIYPGIGVRNDRTQLTPDAAIAQVLATREAGTGGFILFNFDKDLAQITLPAFGSGATLPGGAGETPDGDLIPGVALTVAKAAAGTLELSWGESCDWVVGLTDYAIYRGSLPSGGVWSWDHEPVTCGTGGTTIETIPMAPGNHYFLIVPTDTNREGGYGFDSSGAPRPAAAEPCHAQSRAACP